MKILFCKTSYMKYYRGASEDDIPYNGGTYVKENGYGHEQYNFDPVRLEDGKAYCLGFVETKSNRNKRNDLRIERISGCEGLKNLDRAEDVLVVWCATMAPGTTRVVGWYKHATVFRNYQECDVDNGYIQDYNVIAEANDCFLLPLNERGLMKWNIRTAKEYGCGFGQALVWFGTEDEAQDYIKELTDLIDDFDGGNCMESQSL